MSLPIVFVLGLVAVAMSYCQRMFDPLTLVLAREFAVDPGRIVLLAPAFSIPYAVGQLFLGPLADSVGKARLLRRCLIALMVTTAVSFFVSDYSVLFALRMIMGLSAAGMIPVALAIIGDRVPMEQRQIAYSRYLIASVVGQLFASPVSAALATRWDWSASVLFSSVVTAVALVVVTHQIKSRPDTVLIPFSVGRALATNRMLLANARARACYIMVFIESFCLFGFQPHVVRYLETRGFGSTEEAGYVIGAMGVGGVVFSIVVGWVIRRFSPFSIWRFGAVLGAIGLIAIPLATGWLQVLGAFVFIGLGFYTLHSGIQTQVSEAVPEARSSAVALHASSFFLGYATSPVLMEHAIRVVGVTAVLWSAAAILVVAGLVTARLLQRAAPDQRAR